MNYVCVQAPEENPFFLHFNEFPRREYSHLRTFVTTYYYLLLLYYSTIVLSTKYPGTKSPSLILVW